MYILLVSIDIENKNVILMDFFVILNTYIRRN